MAYSYTPGKGKASEISSVVIGAVLLVISVGATAQSYPSKPVRLVVPAAAAGPTDMIARALGNALSISLGQPFLVDNRPGANGWIANEFVAKAAPDGYTLLLSGTSLMAVQESLSAKLPYDTLRDYSFISSVAGAPSIVVVNSSFPANDLKGLVALAKASPGKLTYANPTPGSANHIASELLKIAAGIDVVNVPYKGASPAEIDVIAGRVTFMFNTLPSSLPKVRAGQFKALAVSSAKRTPFAPDLPTIIESGYPGFDVTTNFGLLGPQGMRPEVVERLNQETRKALQSPAVKEQLMAAGLQEMPSSPTGFQNDFRAEKTKWQKIVKETGVTLDFN